jgi:enoyl-CoA hydratase/carnithine racemase
MAESLLVEIAERFATLTISREQRRNALDDATLVLLKKALEDLTTADVAAIILTGAGSKAFCAGADIKELAAKPLKERIASTDLGQTVGDMIEQHPRPVIAAIEGYCLGGGLEMAMCCDYRLCAEGAMLGLPEVALGALSSWGGTVRLPRLVGQARAKEVILFNRRLGAREALEWGLVNRVVPQGTALEAARSLATEVFAKTDPGIVAIAKGLVAHGTNAPQRAARHLELLADMSVLASDALQSGVTKFAEKGSDRPK